MAALAPFQFGVEGGGEVSALLLRPAKARRLLVLAHGAGAGMCHPFMEKLAGELAGVGVATLRYQFPYMEARRPAPDPPAVLTATVVAAGRAARSEERRVGEECRSRGSPDHLKKKRVKMSRLSVQVI